MVGKPKHASKIKNARAALSDLIIIHLKFASHKVEMNLVDARYTFYDKLANLGGTIGIAEQLTGASFLTLIHLVVLIVKAFFRWISRNEK